MSTFTRDDLAAYAKQTPAAAATAPTADDSAATAVKVADNVSDDATNSDIDLSPDSSPAEETASTDSSGDGTSDDNAVSSTADAESHDSDTHTEGEGTGQGRGRARDRIEDLVSERNALKGYGKHLEARIEELLTKLSTTPAVKTENTASTPVIDKDDPAPTLAQHKYDPDAYAEANAAWLNRQVKKQVAEALQNNEAQKTAIQVRQNFEAKEAELRKVAKDYDIMISNPNLPKLAEGTAKVIVHSDLGPKLTYHLAKNPELATRISRMAPEQQLVAIGRLEGQLSTTTTATSVTKVQPKKTVSNAPPPPTTVSTGGQGQKDQASMSMDEWVQAERNKKLAQRDMKRKIRSGNAR